MSGEAVDNGMGETLSHGEGLAPQLAVLRAPWVHLTLMDCVIKDIQQPRSEAP